MKGTKERRFDPLPRETSLEELVPKDHFYRRLEATLDLSFMRELVRQLYARGGRPSVDPVVFFKLQLVMFFEDLRSERQLMRVVADRLSLRWYLGYDVNESLPHHSTLTRIRERFGLTVFRRFFERIVQECFEAGLVRGEELFFDATKVEANASLDSAGSRALVEYRLGEHLAGIFPEDAPPPRKRRAPRSTPWWDPLAGRARRWRKGTRAGTAGSPRTGARSEGWSSGATSGWRT
jgi:transposase